MAQGRIVHTCRSTGVATHSQAILPLIWKLLEKVGMRLADCDAIAFGCGPGAFTGVRTACGVARGLAFGADLPVIPVVGLHAMAETCRENHQVTDILAILDARMREVYWAQYRYDESDGWRIVIEPRMTPPSGVIPSGQPVACGNGLTAYAESFTALPITAIDDDIIPDSAAVAALAKSAYRRGETLSARDAHPLYLRNKVAYTAEERRVMKAGAPSC